MNFDVNNFTNELNKVGEGFYLHRSADGKFYVDRNREGKLSTRQIIKLSKQAFQAVQQMDQTQRKELSPKLRAGLEKFVIIKHTATANRLFKISTTAISRIINRLPIESLDVARATQFANSLHSLTTGPPPTYICRNADGSYGTTTDKALRLSSQEVAFLVEKASSILIEADGIDPIDRLRLNNHLTSGVRQFRARREEAFLSRKFTLPGSFNRDLRNHPIHTVLDRIPKGITVLTDRAANLRNEIKKLTEDIEKPDREDVTKLSAKKMQLEQELKSIEEMIARKNEIRGAQAIFFAKLDVSGLFPSAIQGSSMDEILPSIAADIDSFLEADTKLL
jgi:hypothetical protein